MRFGVAETKPAVAVRDTARPTATAPGPATHVVAVPYTAAFRARHVSRMPPSKSATTLDRR
ncbi:hypothetical protein DFR68_108403 [Nocardia mexicana]|uniref:Uncharacterized protein n=1 Tax=Nocardia mexicana TaxID=279262 RepID=A0A370GY34_9NOCA|nr:hypothetical protein DFR68_108403 [Nocardia mexicana]